MDDLDNKYKDNGFKVPDGYFDSFEERVLSGIREEKPEKRKMQVSKSRVWWPVAACLVMAIGIGYLASRPSAEVNLAAAMDNVDTAELTAYTNEVDLSEDEFEDIIPVYTVDSLYQAEIASADNTGGLSPLELQDVEEEFSPLDESIDM